MYKSQSMTVLAVGFGTILVLILTMTINWLNYIEHSTQHIEEILEEQEESNLVFKMRDSAHQRAHLLYRIALLEDTFERDEKYIEFKAHASDFIQAKDELVAMGISEHETALWNKVKSRIIEGAQTQIDTIENFIADKNSIARDMLLNQVTPSHEKVLNDLTKMLDYHREESREAVKEAVLSNDQMYGLVIALGVSMFLIGLAVALFTIRNSTRVERELVQLQQAAESASHSKSLFLANMSHEIRTPLTAVIGYAETLQEESLSQAESNECVNTILRNGKHLLNVINDILDLSKIEANKLDVELISVSLLNVVNEVESVMEHTARGKGLALDVDFKFPIPGTIASDPTKLKQVLLNLLSNSIKFTENGSVTLSCEFNAPTSHLIFTVADTGIGMSQEVIERIFSPFAQADASTTRKFGGTGLGLTISRQLAKMLGGDLVCTSEPGKGSKFVLTIYAGWIEEADLIYALPDDVARNNKEELTKNVCVQGNVLIAEDSPDIQALVSMYLRRAGADVVAVDNGKLAVEAAMQDDFDLILMDMQMPVMDGIQATEWLRSTGYDGKIVALTANAMKEEKDRYIAAGINGFLAKPLDLNDFYAMIIEHLESADEHNIVSTDASSEIDELVEQFKQGLPSMLAEISIAIAENELKNISRVAHKLKGMGGSFGFPTITDIAKDLELAAKEGKVEMVDKYFNELSTYCETI